MKRILFLFFCLVILSVDAAAQTTDTFDIATFRTPNGWKKQSKNGALFLSTANEAKGTYAMIVIFGSGPSTGTAKGNFDSDWQRFIARQFSIKEAPQMEPAESIDGWAVLTGGTAFKNEQGTAAVILKTYSGSGIVFSMSVVFNSQDYMPAIEAFSSSVTLGKPAAGPQTTVAGDNASVIGTWGVSASDQSTIAVSNAVSGYIVRQYTFNTDGTYTFLSKTFSPFLDKLLLGRENGTYQVNGNSITISPKKSALEAWSKKDGMDVWGRLLTSQNRPLENITYQLTKHYFSGVKEWSLVFQSGSVTQRDGPYSGGGAFNNAWIYSPPCSKCFIELPGR